LPTSSGVYAPANEIVGPAAAGSVWRIATRRSDRPLPNAVRTNSASPAAANRRVANVR